MVWHYDGQVADEASIPLFLLSKAVRKHVKVALTGDGGDEFFAGYPTYMASRAASVLGRCSPRFLWRYIAKIAYTLDRSNEDRLPPIAKLKRFAMGLGDGGAARAHAYWRRYVPGFSLPDLYGPNLKAMLDVDPFADYHGLMTDASGKAIDRYLLSDQRFHLPGGLLLKSDFMSMANSLEIRVPLLDRRIMDFAGRIDGTVLQGGGSKRVLREASQKMGAPEEIARAAKRGFNSPLAQLLRGALKPMAERCFDQELDRLEPWLQPDTMRRLWRDHSARTANHDYALWAALHLSLSLDNLEHCGEASEGRTSASSSSAAVS